MKYLRPSIRSVVIAAALILSAPLMLGAQTAAPVTITLTQAQTSVAWTLGTTLHTVHGTFKLKSGEFRVDTATGDASGAIVIDATSGESGDSARDKHMQSAVLESAQYPTITFRPKHVSGKIDLTAASSVTVDGVLNLHGTDHPLQITVHLTPRAPGIAMVTHFSIPYVAWGLKDPSTFVLRADKSVVLDVEATFASDAGHSAAKPILPPPGVRTAQ